MLKIDFTKPWRTSLAIIGDLMLDRYLYGSADRISPEAPIPVVDVKKEENILGGAANVMNNAANLGAKVWGLGVIGSDNEGRWIKSELENMGVNVENIVTEKKRPSTVKNRIMVGHHQMLRYDIEARREITHNSEVRLLNGLNKIINAIDMILISDYDKGVMTPPLIKSILDMAAKNGKPVLVDPKVKNTKYYVGVDYVKINLHNAEKFTQVESSSNNIRKMCILLAKNLACSNIILTLGKDGLMMYSKKHFHHIRSIAKDVYDVTGAGDVMTSVLGTALSDGYDLITSCNLATIAAAIKVGKVGTYSLSLRELQNAVKNYNSGMQI